MRAPTSAAIKLILGLASHVPAVVSIVFDAASDGDVTVEDAQTIAARASAELGDLRVNVRGVDIVDNKAQRQLSKALGRIGWNLAQALKGQ